MISLTRQQMENEFASFCEELFRLPEIESIKARSVTVRRENLRETAKEAVAIGYHDCFSDIDMGIRVCLPEDGSVTPEEYMRRIDRFGVTDETALGWMFVPENAMYRIIFRNGMRYDFGFEFTYADGASMELGEAPAYTENANWPLENIRRFWFVQIQALAKLYRRDYLIGASREHELQRDARDADGVTGRKVRNQPPSLRVLGGVGVREGSGADAVPKRGCNV